MSWLIPKFLKGSPTKDDAAAAAAGEDDAVRPDDADEVLPEDSRSLLLQLISKNGLSMGVDLSKVALPTFILEPRSLLQKLSDTIVHPEFFSTLSSGANPLERIVRVAQWYFSAFHVRPRGAKKPFNPVLGEVFRCRYDCDIPELADSVSPVTWVSQQVSHHPPVSAFFARTEDGKVVLEGTFAPKSKFLGNSAASMGGGNMRLYLPQHDETYIINWPSAYVRGVLFGTLLMELGGHVTIACVQTKLAAEIEFVTKGFFTGKYHEIKGHIAAGGGAGSKIISLDGSWTSRVRQTDLMTEDSKVLFDKAASSRLGRITVLPAFDEAANAAIPPTLRCYSSVDLWAPVAQAILGGDLDAATVGKTQIEEYQRELRTQRTERREPFVPSLFRHEGEDVSTGWRFIGEGAVSIPPSSP